MNFLAHLYLSGTSKELIVGNFIGDFVKGNKLNEYQEGISLGIQLHRAIDEYTDLHDIVKQSKSKLWDKYRHYSGVIIDMYYDHFLAKNWEMYHKTPLKEYSNKMYEIILEFESVLPKGVKYMLPYMMKGNWLYNYSKIEGIAQALSGMSRRTTFKSKMELAETDLRANYDQFEKEFQLFFPDLKSFSDLWKKEQGISPNSI